MANVTAPAAPAKNISFRYEALDLTLNKVKGTVKAPNEVAAQNILVGRGYSSLALEPVPSPLSLEGMIPSLYKVKPAQVITFSRQLATLIESGVTLLPAIQLLSQQRSGSPVFRRVLSYIASDLSTGSSLSQSIARHSKVFNEIYRRIARHSKVFNEIYRRTIEVGERTGHLETVLRELADHLEKQAVLGKKLKAAMTYPAILLTVGVLVTIVLLVVVLPPLADMFTQLNADVPLPTRVLMATSNFAVDNFIYLMGAMVVIAMAVAYSWKRPNPDSSGGSRTGHAWPGRGKNVYLGGAPQIHIDSG